MPARLAKGELLLALLFGIVGVIWIVGASGLSLWEGFAPNTGFLPLVYGILLAALSAAIAVNLFLEAPGDEAPPPIGKPILLIGVLTATVIGIGVIGFAAAIFLMLLFLYAGLERLSLLPSFVTAGATTGALILIFEVWLDVPLPLGPMGF